MTILIHGEAVTGVDIGPQTRCAHYHTELDIIAIKFKCCGQWFPCFECHAETAGHEASVWPIGERGTHAILCGNCGHQFTINEYFDSNSICPSCDSKFNPGCENHYHLYFEL